MHALPTHRSPLFSLFLALSLILAMASTVLAAPVAAPLNQTLDETEIANRIVAIRSELPDIEDDFTADNGTWSIGYTGDTTVYFRAGMLHVAIDVESTVAWGESATRATDFYAEVDSVHREGALNNQFGILFQLEDNQNFYFFSVGSDGYYALQRLVDGEWEMPIEWVESELIETGEGSENTIGLLLEGSNLTLLINDYIVEQVEGIDPLEGKLALAAGSYDEPGVGVAFDNFAVWLLGDNSSGPRSNRPVRVPDLPDAPPTPQLDETDEPAPPEPGPTPLPEETTPDEFIDAIRAEIPLFIDDFSQETADWEPNLFDGMEYGVVDGEVQIGVDIPSSLGWSILDQRYEDFYLEVDTTYLGDPAIEEHGVLFHYVDPQNFYFFAVSATGEYSLWRLHENEWQPIEDWTLTGTLDTTPGATNRLGLLVQGGQFTLLINDQVVVETGDDTFPAGAIGLAVGTFDEVGARAAFDNITIWGIEAAGDSPTRPDTLLLPTPETPASETHARIDAILVDAPTFDDDFRRDQRNWDLGPYDNSEISFDRRALHLEITSTDWLAWSLFLGGAEGPLSLSDLYAEADIAFVQAPEASIAGLVFRLQDADNFYLYALDATGSYSLQKKVDGQWIDLIPWTESDLIETGEGAINRVGVLAEGDHLALILNGDLVGEVDDTDLAEGIMAIAAGTGAVAGVEVSFDNFALWDLSQ